MANDNVQKFEELLRTDEAVQAQLNEAVSAYDGDPNDQEAVFEATIGKIAASVGLPFELEEGKNHLLAGRALSDAELAAVAGGVGVCYVIGGSDEPEAHCERAEGYACAYVGVTWGNKHA